MAVAAAALVVFRIAARVVAAVRGLVGNSAENSEVGSMCRVAEEPLRGVGARERMGLARGKGQGKN